MSDVDIFRKWLSGTSNPITPSNTNASDDRIYVSLSKMEGLGAGVQEERTTSPKVISKLRLLYKTDPLTYRVVEDYKAGIITEFIFESPGHEKDVKFCNEWSNNIGLKQSYINIIQDIVLGGNGWAELIIYDDDPFVKVKVLNPDTMDYIREVSNQQVSLMSDQTIEGFEQKYMMSSVKTNTVQWTKNKITQNGKTILGNNRAGEDLRTRITHHKLWGWGDSWIGTTPLVACYKSAIIRMNIADMIGETSFRGGGLQASVPKGATENSKKILREELKNLTSKNILVHEEDVAVDLIPIPELANRDKLMYSFADEFATGMMTYLPLMMSVPGSDIARGERDEMSAKFEMYLQMLREIICSQIRQTVLQKLWDSSGKTTPLPYVKLADRSQITMLNLSRVIATLSRRDLITSDPELELYLRKSTGLPTKYVEQEIKRWDEEGISSKPPAKGGLFGQPDTVDISDKTKKSEVKKDSKIKGDNQVPVKGKSGKGSGGSDDPTKDDE